MVPNVQLTVTLTWNKPEFYMMQPATNTRHYRLDPAQAYLHIDKAELNHDVLADLTRKISKNPVIYHTTGIAKEGGGILMDLLLLETVIQNYVVGKGQRFFRSPPISQDSKTPFKIYVAFVDFHAYLGNEHMNPFDFR